MGCTKLLTLRGLKLLWSFLKIMTNGFGNASFAFDSQTMIVVDCQTVICTVITDNLLGRKERGLGLNLLLAQKQISLSRFLSSVMILSSSACMPLCRYLRNILSRQSSAHNVSELIESLNAIDSWVQILYTCCNVNIPWMIPVTYFTDSNNGVARKDSVQGKHCFIIFNECYSILDRAMCCFGYLYHSTLFVALYAG